MGVDGLMDIGASAIEAQMMWFRMLAARGFPHRELPDGLAVASGLPSNTENGAVLHPGAAASEEILAWLTARDVPASVVLTAPAPAEQLEQLMALGLRPESSGTEMGARLADLRWPAPGSGGRAGDIVVAEITGRPALEETFVLLRDAAWYDDEERARWVGAAEQTGFGPGTPVRHWIARIEATCVGVATSFVFGHAPERTVALVRLCVAEQHHRRGIGTALTRARVEAAVLDGAQQAVLSPSPDGYELHSRLGFTPVSTPLCRWFYL